MSQQTAAWLPDLGDGSYQNPILNADYSDPDAIRVGDDYWMTSSSFSHAPGLPILHSRDLVNWTLVNHALPALVPTDHFAQPRHGCGVWAPCLRHHAGLFWIVYPDPDFGLYVITATDPRGQWSSPHLLKAGKGLIDPSPLWDEDGRAWLVHGWAKSRSGINNLLTLHEVTPDLRTVLDAGETVIDANKMPGWKTLEGPKFYKRDGWYWIFAPAGGVAEGYQAVFRSRNVRGPYEARNVLEQGGTPINGPHQGAWVETQTGEHWFMHFQELPALGRVVHLQPMRWLEDGWPVMGRVTTDPTRGEPVLRHAKPAGIPQQPITAPAGSDDFDAPVLGLQWQWEGNPQPGWYDLGARPGWLRLACTQRRTAGNFWDSGHLCMQKLPRADFSAQTLLEFSPKAEGDTAGLIVFGYSYAWLGLRQTQAGLRLELVRCDDAKGGGREQILASIPWQAGLPVHLRAALNARRDCFLSYSADGNQWTLLNPAFIVPSSHWVGAKVGVFASTDAGTASQGFADFDHMIVKA